MIENLVSFVWTDYIDRIITVNGIESITNSYWCGHLVMIRVNLADFDSVEDWIISPNKVTAIYMHRSFTTQDREDIVHEGFGATVLDDEMLMALETEGYYRSLEHSSFAWPYEVVRLALQRSSLTVPRYTHVNAEDLVQARLDLDSSLAHYWQQLYLLNLHYLDTLYQYTRRAQPDPQVKTRWQKERDVATEQLINRVRGESIAANLPLDAASTTTTHNPNV